MQIIYNAATDLVYIQIDDAQQSVINRRVTDDIVLDIDEDERIVGIEILDASKHLDLAKMLPVEFRSAV